MAPVHNETQNHKHIPTWTEEMYEVFFWIVSFSITLCLELAKSKVSILFVFFKVMLVFHPT